MPNSSHHFSMALAETQTQSVSKKASKLSRKQWRILKKKEKRRALRQAEAREKPDKNSGGAQSSGSLSSDEERQREEERTREEQHQRWLERERVAQREWQLKREREEKEKQRIEEQKKQIQAEWEEREKKEKEEREEREKKEKAKREKQEALLKEATANENKGEGAWHNPIAPLNYGKEQLRETCPFFKKTGACRFGDRCSRAHPDPEDCSTLLFPGMYSNFLLEQTLRDEYDMDLALEYEDGETYQHFRDFYQDVLPEFKSVGRVIQFKVCCNYEPHLRGNVYVQFHREDEAQAAFMKFNGRFYGGKQLSAQFVSIERWKLAICGLYGRKQCPKGKNCNFLHVFRNPDGEFRDADLDFERSSRGWGSWGSERERSVSSRYNNNRDRNNRYIHDRYSHRKSRSRSRDRVSRSRSHRRSRSRSRDRRRKRSIESRSRLSRSRSPSKSKSRRRSRSRSRDRRQRRHSRSPDDSRKQRRRKSRSRSRSRSRHSHGIPDRSSSATPSYKKASVPPSESRDKTLINQCSQKSDSSDSSDSDGDETYQSRKKRSKSRRKHKKRKTENGIMPVDTVSKPEEDLRESESVGNNISETVKVCDSENANKLALVDEIIRQSFTE